jgi:hypothetical protein
VPRCYDFQVGPHWAARTAPKEHEMTATNTAAAATAAVKDCECSKWEIGHTQDSDESGTGQPEWFGIGTGCNATTRRDFAPGHDAKLKSLLIQAGVDGHSEIRKDNGGVAHIFGDAVQAASQYGFAHMVQKGIEIGIAKKAAKKDKPARKTPADRKVKGADRAAKLQEKLESKGKTVAPAGDMPREVPVTVVAPAVQEPTTPGLVQVKIGRWIYDAKIEGGNAYYTDKKGNDKVALDGVFTLVA